MIAGLEVYDRLGRLIMGAEDYNRYILGTIDLRGVYFGADHYNKKILEHEQTITVDCPHFDSHCKLIPVMDIGVLPYRQSGSRSLLPPERDEVYKLVGSGKLLTIDEYNKGFCERVYSYFPVAQSYSYWAFSWSYTSGVLGSPDGIHQGIHYWCPEPGKVSYNTGGSMEANWLAFADQDQSEYKEGDTYCGISWLVMRCLVLGRL